MEVWKLELPGNCVPKLELGNKGEAGPAGAGIGNKENGGVSNWRQFPPVKFMPMRNRADLTGASIFQV